MSWKVKYYENGDNIYCEVDHHPVNNVVGGGAAHVPLNHPVLIGWNPPSNFDPQNDEVVLLYLVTGTNPTTKSVLDSRRDVTPNNQHIVAVPVQETASGPIRRGRGKRSKNKVSDEMGGGGDT